MTQPRIGQRVTVIDGSGPESGVSGVIVRQGVSPTEGQRIIARHRKLAGRLRPIVYPEVVIRDDSGRLFSVFPYQLQFSRKSA